MSGEISPKVRSVDGLQIRYAESKAVAEPTVLMLNPWPESLYAWEAVWPRLQAHAKLIAVDLPGFGQSEARDDLVSPHAMGSFVVQLIDEWELGAPHVFGPDIGTGATLFAAALAPDALTSAVIGGGGSAYPLEVSGRLKELIEAPDLEALRSADGRDVVADAMTLLESYKPSETAREDYLDSYAAPGSPSPRATSGATRLISRRSATCFPRSGRRYGSSPASGILWFRSLTRSTSTSVCPAAGLRFSTPDISLGRTRPSSGVLSRSSGSRAATR